MLFGGAYDGRRVLVTGFAGFKGSWLTAWLCELGAEVCGYSLRPGTRHELFRILDLPSRMFAAEFADICDAQKLEDFFCSVRPQTVFHLAAQPLVRLSYAQPVETYRTNVMGTLNVLEAARKCGSVEAFINVTSDKCYENSETGRAFRESDPMGGFDMYSSSKGCSEILTASYRRSFLDGGRGYALASARAGNVIGGGDWAADRLVPDCVRALASGAPIEVRNPDAVRPWEHVLEPLAGYLLLGERLLEEPGRFADCFNFGPSEGSVLKVGQIAEMIVRRWGGGEICTPSSAGPHEARLLSLDISKASEMLGFRPVADASEAVDMTADWYKNFYGGRTDMREFTLSQLDGFCARARGKNIVWSK